MSKPASNEQSSNKSPVGFPTPLPFHESEITRRRHATIHATKRVLAPFVKARRKPVVKTAENKYFSFYVQKKPSILMNDMSKLLFEGVDLISVLAETADVLKEATNSTGKFSLTGSATADLKLI